MRLIDGKFYEGNVIVPIEFGNKEQIKLINDQQNLLAHLTGDGLVIDPNIETVQKVSISEKCLCGGFLNFHDHEFEEFEDVNVNDKLKGEQATCHKCKKKYVIDIFDGDLVMKLKK